MRARAINTTHGRRTMSLLHSSPSATAPGTCDAGPTPTHRVVKPSPCLAPPRHLTHAHNTQAGLPKPLGQDVGFLGPRTIPPPPPQEFAPRTASPVASGFSHMTIPGHIFSPPFPLFFPPHTATMAAGESGLDEELAALTFEIEGGSGGYSNGGGGEGAGGGLVPRDGRRGGRSMAPGSKNVVCIHYLVGMCALDKDCPYLHQYRPMRKKD